MSIILHQILQGLPMFNPITKTILLTLQNLLKERKGDFIQWRPDCFNFSYYLPQKNNEMKKVIVAFEERKSSYKFLIVSDIDPKILSHGPVRLTKFIENLNKNTLMENNLYYFQQPDQFGVRSSIQKDSLVELEEQSVKIYFKNLFENTNSQFILSLTRLWEIVHEEQYPSTGLKQISQLLTQYRTLVNQQISRRNNQQKQNREAKYKIPNKNELNPTIVKEQIKVFQQNTKLNFYLRKIKGEKNQSSKDSGQSTKPLAHKIIMMKESVDKNWKAPQSSYGNLERVQAEYITISSFNDAVAELLDKEKKQNKSAESDKLNRSILVRKNYKKKQKCPQCVNGVNPKCECFVRLKSYETEIAIVSCIRNVMAESVASYFLEINGPDQAKVAKLYSKFYPKCLSNEKLKPKDIIPFVMHFFEALKLFDSLSILHRDLKPDNILIDSNKVPKIIDFGSAWILNRTFLKETDISLNPHLLTTQKYNLYYQEAFFAQRHLMTAEQFEQHPLYDLFAFGVITSQLYSSSQVSSELGNIVKQNLNWLVAKCQDNNPNCRPNIDEIENFLSLLNKFWNIKSQPSKK